MRTATRNVALAGALITLATLVSYWNVRYNQLIGYDDVKYLIDNEVVRRGLTLDGLRWALTATYDANWFPLTWLSHMLDISLFGFNPLGHHLINLLLHIANALLLMNILHRVTGHLWRSTAVALLFALHPLHVESVAWAAERKDVLSTLFFMLSIKAYIGFSETRTLKSYLLALAAFAAGLASKPMLVSLPCVLLLLDFWPLRRLRLSSAERSWGKKPKLSSLLLEKLPFIALALASCVITFIVQRNGGTINAPGDSSQFPDALFALHNYLTYLCMLVWPVHLAAIYPFVPDLPAWKLAGSAFVITALSLLAVRHRRAFPHATMGWAWFLATLIPVVGFVRIGVHSVADRYTYIPSIGIFIAVVWLAADVLRHRAYGRSMAAALMVCTCVSLAVLTWQQITYWKDSITLFSHTLAVTRENWVAHGNLAAELIKYGRTHEALLHLEQAERINPQSYVASYNLGLVLNSMGRAQEAAAAFRRALLLRPESAEAYFEAGRTAQTIGDTAGAQEMLAGLRALDPELADVLERQYILLDRMRAAAPQLAR